MSSRYMQPLRILIQCVFLVFVFWIGFRFYQFVHAVSYGDEMVAVRPDGVEAFLPISGLMGVASWIKHGEINNIHPAAVIVFVTAILTSFLLRRSFCSWICPVSTISEFSWKLGFRLFRRNWRPVKWLDMVLRSIKYLLLFFFIFFIAIAMSPDALLTFLQSDYHKIADARLLYFFVAITPRALAIIVFLVSLSFILRNPLCRYLCPYGALLGLVAMLSPVRVTRDKVRCISCGVCSSVCPSYIDIMHTSSVNSPECIACWRCVSHCRFNEALKMRTFQRFTIPGFVFAALVVMFFISGTMIGKMTGHWHTLISREEYVRLLGK